MVTKLLSRRLDSSVIIRRNASRQKCAEQEQTRQKKNQTKGKKAKVRINREKKYKLIGGGGPT